MPCSYCRSREHTIANCTCPTIDNWNIYLSRLYARSNDYEHFVLYTRGIGKMQIKAMSVKYTRLPANRPIQEHTLALWNYYQSFRSTRSYYESESETKQTNTKKLKIIVNRDSFENMASFECGICLETVHTNNTVVFGCKHQFCGSCVKNQLKIQNSNCCALCRTAFNNVIVKNINMFNYLNESA